MDLNPILRALNREAHRFEFGRLQDIRKQRRPLGRQPTRFPFGSTTREWAHHVGGWSELQFNVASDDGHLRWGIAISLQPSASLRDPSVMYPKLARLARFLEAHSEYLRNRGYVMWDYRGSGDNRTRSLDRAPQPFSAHFYEWGDFVFLGKHAPFESFAADTVLRDFDRLLPLYEFVEFEPDAAPPLLSKPGVFAFVPDKPSLSQPIVNRTRAVKTPAEIDVSRRHEILQQVLKRNLINKPGVQVATELSDARGGSIDLVVCCDGELEFYEIKTAATAKQCVREAMGQLLEYAYRPPAIRPKRLFVAGGTCDRPRYRGLPKHFANRTADSDPIPTRRGFRLVVHIGPVRRLSPESRGAHCNPCLA